MEKEGELKKGQKTPIALYEMMYRIRTFENIAMVKYQQGDMPGFMHLCQGEEAVAAGICASLSPADIVTSTHRGHGHAIGKGIFLGEIMAELFGRRDGCSGGRGGSMHIFKKSIGFLGTNGMVGGGIGLAVGAALSMKLRGEPHIAVTFFGDGASNMGISYESYNLASKMNLPIVFVCENNLYATSTRLTDVAANPEIASRAKAFHMAGKSIDGNDIEKVFEAFSEAKEKALRGEGPTLLECKTYRYGGHSIGDTVYGLYRTKEEVETWKLLYDPLENYKRRLIEIYNISDAIVNEAEEKVRGEIGDAVAFAESSPLPDPDSVEDNIFWEGGTKH